MKKGSLFLVSLLGGIVLSSCATANNAGGEAASSTQQNLLEANQIAATVPLTANTADTNKATPKTLAPTKVKSQLFDYFLKFRSSSGNRK